MERTGNDLRPTRGTIPERVENARSPARKRPEPGPEPGPEATLETTRSPTRSLARGTIPERPDPPENDPKTTRKPMLSALYYIFLVLLCTLFMILSAIALVVCYPFDPARRVVHELSRILVRIFFFIPLRWRQKVEGRELVDRHKSYVIVLNHNTVIDIPALYYLPLNFRWVSKREVFRVPFFGQYLVLHGDICIDRGRAAEALEQMLREGRKWISRGARARARRTGRSTASRPGPSPLPGRRGSAFSPW